MTVPQWSGAHGRREPEELVDAAVFFENSPIERALNAVNDYVFILNDSRQILFANKRFLNALGVPRGAFVRGKRPGEALGCENSCLHPDGCGESEFCFTCGALLSIRQALAGKPCVEECRIVRRAESGMVALDLRVTCTPEDCDCGRVVIFAAQDISAEKRRTTLERIFFHDVLNTASGVKGLMEFVCSSVPEEMRETTDLVHVHFNYLVEEITAQMELGQAESGELLTRKAVLSAADVVRQAVRFFEHQSMAVGRAIEMELPADPPALRTDPKLLRRVLVNLVKNALEAPEGGDVLVRLERDGGRVRFCVRNAAVIPADVQPQLFHRSFSTKGSGRGYGTYSIRLLTERYLGGSVSFSSEPGRGTEFVVSLPAA
jgi:hypothetical protein